MAETVAALVAAGADVDAPFEGGPHAETPLHWAASSDDLAALDALLDAGADIEAPGAVIGGGTPLADAVAFGQWQAARRLIERGAHANLWQAAALGLLDRVEAELAAGATPQEVTAGVLAGLPRRAARDGGAAAPRGAELDWVGWNDQTPLDIAEAQGAGELVAWLRERGASSAAELDAAP